MIAQRHHEAVPKLKPRGKSGSRTARNVLLGAAVSVVILAGACNKLDRKEGEGPGIPEPQTVGLPWHSRNLHPELVDPSPLILTPQEIRVPDSWRKEVLSTEPVWKVSVSGTCPVRKEVGINLKAGSPSWNIYSKLWVALDVVNKGDASVLLRGGLLHPTGPVGAEVVAPGETRTLAILIIRQLKEEDAYLRAAVPNLSGLPGGHVDSWRRINPEEVKEVTLHASSAAPHIALELSNLRAVIDFQPPSRETLESGFVPYMDRFGQNRHETWTGKITSVAELRAAAEQEQASLGRTPRVKSWDKFGGWADGPKLEATGHFRVQKYGGAWWFVDPEGRLFWSFGVNCVIGEDFDGILSTHTPGLREILAETPADEPPPSALPGVSERQWSPYMANLFRKSGESWHTDFVSMAHRRLEAWGLNTIGNWSEPAVPLARQTPYVLAVHYDRPALHKGETYFQADLPDVFAPEFNGSLKKAVAKVAAGSADDPWCIGYFVDNEMPFKSTWQVAQEMIKAPPRTHTKMAFLQQLQQKYPDVADLNKKWGTSFGAWEDVLGKTELPGGDGCREDAIAFAIEFLNRYYALCREAVKEAAPNKLYLGSRANQYFKELFEICATHADVISINLYQHSPVAVPLLKDFAGDKPFLIGEFHFGTLTEQGVWGPGLTQAKDVAHSGRLLERFIDDCLADPRLIGAHWFLFADQPLSGRGDAENFRVGFVNIVDVPHAPLIQSSRALGERLYEMRNKAFSPTPDETAAASGNNGQNPQ